MEKIKLSEYLRLSVQFKENPTDENLQLIKNFMDKLIIREYIPLKEKEVIMVNILAFISKDFDAPGAAGFIEMGKIEKGLFAYCINLENDSTILNNNFISYDLYYQCGLVDYILSRCEKDYQRFEKIIDNSIQISNLYRLLQTAEFLDENAYDNWIQTMTDLKDTINSESLQKILDLATTEDENLLDLAKVIQEEALEEMRVEDKSEQNKFKNAVEILSKNHKDNEEDEDNKDNENKA